MRLKLLSTTTLVFLGLLISGCNEKENKSESITKEIVKKEVKKEVKSYILRDSNSTIVIKESNNGFKFYNIDKPVVLLNFFATWCPPCRAEIPHLSNLQRKYKDKLKIVAVLVENKDKNEIEKFKQKYNINYFISNSLDNMSLALKTADMLHQPRNFSIPMMVLFVNGKYYRHYIGMVPEEMLESDIKDAIK
jgi:thiol-disulfide isomerase/thioredoxin